MAMTAMNMVNGGGGSAEISALLASASLSTSTTSLNPTLLPASLDGVKFTKTVLLSGQKASGAKTLTVTTPSKAKVILVFINALILSYNTDTNECLRIESDSSVASSTLIQSVTASTDSVTFTIDNFSSAVAYGVALLCE